MMNEQADPRFPRPWRGLDATTGFTMDEFKTCLVDCKASVAAQRAAIAICRSYGITGICDPAYIANVIEAAKGEAA